MNNEFLTRIKLEVKKHKLGKFAVFIICFFSLISILAFLSPYNPDKIIISDRLQSPNKFHWFGTDTMGRDYFTRILHGGRVSLSVGFLSMLIATTLGAVVGSICGYFEGKLDSIIMRIVDILMCIPSFFVILVLNAYLKPGISTIVCIIGFLGWMGTSRLVRAETLSVKKQEYVLYAKSLGISDFTIIMRHIIPNVLPTIIVAASLSIASAIMTESSLSFLGVGVQAPKASWGSMLSSSQGYIEQAPYLSFFPGLFILLTVLSFNIFGDILRETIEPKES